MVAGEGLLVIAAQSQVPVADGENRLPLFQKFRDELRGPHHHVPLVDGEELLRGVEMGPRNPL